MLMTGTVHAEPEMVIVLPGNTWLPLAAALFLAMFFGGVLLKEYAVALIGLSLAAATLLRWAWLTGAPKSADSVDAGNGTRLQLHYTAASPPGWWGLMWTLVADAALFASLVFSYLYLWTVRPEWPPHQLAALSWSAALPGLFILGSAALAVKAGAERGASRSAALCWGGAAVLGAAFIAIQAWTLSSSGLLAREHAYAAFIYTLFGFSACHVAIAVLMALFRLARVLRAHPEAGCRGEARIIATFWLYVLAQWGICFVLIHIAPLLVRVGGGP